MISQTVLVLDLVWPGIAAGAAAAAILPWLKRENEAARAGLVAIAVFLVLRYLLWRGLETLPEAGFTINFLTGIVFYGVETVALLGASLNLVFLSRVRNRSGDADRNAAWLAAQNPAPLVDVLICTYNEEYDILERTIIGALAMSYPNFRLWVCDDGKRPWLKDLCARLNCGYLTRPDNRHAKAGNINSALAILGNLPERPQFISILDADFVPRAQFLSRALTLFRDPKIGIVQTPQHFINPDPIQSNLSAASAWPDEQRFFFDIVMPSKDAWATAFCCGTSSVIRYAPLAAMGGFPTDSVTEDYLLTLRMKEHGHGTAYLNEALTLGLAPEGIKEYLTQRGRWCLGFIQICRGRSGPFSRTSPLPLIDRLSLVEGFIYWAFTYSYRLLGILIPIAYLLFGIKALTAGVGDLFNHFLPFFIWNTMVMGWIAQGRILPVMSDVCQLLATPTILKSAATGLFSTGNQRFQVTAKGGDRSKRFIEWPLMQFFLFLLALTFAGIFTAWLSDGALNDDGSLMAMVWSWYNIVVLSVACFVCIESPRLRRSERFETSQHAEIDFGNGVSSTAVLADISILGAKLLGVVTFAPRTPVKLRFQGMTIPGEIVRVTKKEFALRFDDSLETRATLIRHIYAGSYHHEFSDVKPSTLSLAVAKRLFR
jgi:cellulose synthase (UDP-forming)